MHNDLMFHFIPVFEELVLRSGIGPLEIFRALASHKKDAAFFQQNQMEADVLIPGETVLAIDPFETIRVSRQRVVIENEMGQQKVEGGDPFSIISERMSAFFASRDPVLGAPGPVFRGGALGYFAYDAIRSLEPSLTYYSGNLQDLESTDPSSQFVSEYPDRYDAEFMFFRKAVIFDHRNNRVLLMAGYFEYEKFNETGLRRARTEIEELRTLCQSASRYFPLSQSALNDYLETAPEIPLEDFECMLGKKRFFEGVRKLKSHIRAGDIFQAVLSEKFRIPFLGDPFELFRILSCLNPAPYSYYFSFGGRVKLGASPEMLLKLEDQVIETHPIAGTRPRGATPAEDQKLERQLRRSTKEHAEHLMLVDLARNDVGRVSGPGTVRVKSFMELRKFSGVMHLISRVTGKLLNSTTGVEALAASFPAGTLSGAPKIRAMQLLSELEPVPRGFYGGAVVAASFTGELDSCIAIRGIQVENGMALIQAGAGVVADSRPEQEYQEVLHKSRMARRALAVANQALHDQNQEKVV